MSMKKTLIPILVCALLLTACDYIVLPEEESTPAALASKGWTALVTAVGPASAGGLRVELAIRNETAEWSAMQAVPGQPATLTAGDGKTARCDTVFVGTGGHRLAPGFQMRGYTAGTKAEPQVQLLYVECAGAAAAPGARLSLDYTYVTGEYNYYYQEANKANGTLEVRLDDVVKDATYPVAAAPAGLIQGSDAPIKAINNCALALAGVARSDKGLQFTWQVTNPGEYPTYVHIGNPPVIGADGILYGLYESPDVASVPVAGPGKTAEWTTEVAAPADARGLYILLSVESKKQRLFANYAIDITGK